MNCSPEKIAALNADLEAARAGYRRIIRGEAPKVMVDQSGERLEFFAADPRKLQTLIAEIELQIAECTGSSTLAFVPRPLRFNF